MVDLYHMYGRKGCACRGEGRTHTDRGKGGGGRLCDEGDQLLRLQVDGQEAAALLADRLDHALGKRRDLHRHHTRAYSSVGQY